MIAQSSFSDLRTIVADRAPWMATRREVTEALAIAEKRGDFRLAEVSPQAAAAEIHVPVLLIHGDRDHETGPEHSQRILDARRGPKKLLLVRGAGHNDALGREEVWQEIERWMDGL